MEGRPRAWAPVIHVGDHTQFLAPGPCAHLRGEPAAGKCLFRYHGSFLNEQKAAYAHVNVLDLYSVTS